MKNLKILILGLILLWYLIFFNFKISYGKDLDIGISIYDRKISHFYFFIGDHYQIPIEKIIIIKEKYPIIIDEDFPIIFLICKERKVKPDIIIKMRKKGYSWYSIMLYFELPPEKIFRKYIITYRHPYGKAWGYYKHHLKKNKIIIFTDEDIIKLANIKFLIEYYYTKPELKLMKFID